MLKKETFLQIAQRLDNGASRYQIQKEINCSGKTAAAVGAFRDRIRKEKQESVSLEEMAELWEKERKTARKEKFTARAAAKKIPPVEIFAWIKEGERLHHYRHSVSQMERFFRRLPEHERTALSSEEMATRWLAEGTCKRHHKGKTSENADMVSRIREEYGKGLSIRQVGEIVNVSFETVRNVLREYEEGYRAAAIQRKKRKRTPTPVQVQEQVVTKLAT